jgi:hypothetical protein
MRASCSAVLDIVDLIASNTTEKHRFLCSYYVFSPLLVTAYHYSPPPPLSKEQFHNAGKVRRQMQGQLPTMNVWSTNPKNVRRCVSPYY